MAVDISLKPIDNNGVTDTERQTKGRKSMKNITISEAMTAIETLVSYDYREKPYPNSSYTKYYFNGRLVAKIVPISAGRYDLLQYC